MSSTKGCPLRIILYEGPGSRSLGDRERFRLLTSIINQGYGVTRSCEGLASSTEGAGRALVLGCFGNGAPHRPADWDRDVSLRFADISELGADQVVALIESTAEELDAVRPGERPSWFPVIDHDRCTDCQQCLRFCLFGVYGLDADDRVVVLHPDRCVAGHVACTRICPGTAIIFPKHHDPPVNGASTRPPKDGRETTMEPDILPGTQGEIASWLGTHVVSGKTPVLPESSERLAGGKTRCEQHVGARGCD
jgi:NAD-dependent dihydropyrimidine dehydrogenase PreA subunit